MNRTVPATTEESDGLADRSVPRRTFLGGIAAAGVAPPLQAGGNADDDQDVEVHFEFGGQVEGWEGRSPAEIEDEVNPRLDLVPGTDYRVTWENLDGVEHDFVILDAEGNEITGTEITAEQGETLSLTFTATEEMAQYYCSIHPNQMSGRIQLGDEDEGADTPTEAAEVVDAEIELGGTVDGWEGRAPSEIEGETNPTLDLRAGNRYRVQWENVDGVQHGFALLDDDGTQLESTEITSVEGETRSLTFTASAEIAQYYCVIHTDAMRGDVRVGEETPADDTPTEAADVETRFDLGGAIQGWQGRLPEEADADNYIEGEENPTLELEAGSRYLVTWENLDDVPHDFTIRDTDENGLIATEVAENQGERRSITFTASEEMDHYVCTFHLDTMRGAIEIGGSDDGVEELLPPDPTQLVGGAVAATAGAVVGLGYVLSRVFDQSHEP